MPAKNPRINVVLEPELRRVIQKIAARDGVSVSLKTRDLIREALEMKEDTYWNEVAEAREKYCPRGKMVSHDETWK